MKRLCYILSGLIAVFLISVAGSSSASAAGSPFYGPLSSMISPIASMELLGTAGQYDSCSQRGSGFKCSVSVNSELTGLHFTTQYLVPSNSVVYLNVWIGSERAQESFLGFVGSSNVIILDQSVETTWQGASVQLQFMLGDTGARSDFYLNIGTGSRVTFLENAPGSVNGNASVEISAITAYQILDGSWVAESLGQISSINTYAQQISTKTDTTNDLLTQIKNNGITAKVDNSGVINAVNQQGQAQINATNSNTTAVNNAANQAHKDSQAQLDEQKKANDIAEEQKNFITDTTPPEVDSSSLSGASGWLPPGPLDSILTLPATLLSGIVDVFTGSKNCHPVQLPLPYVDEDLALPCVRPLLDQIGATTIFDIVGGVIGAFIIFDTLKWLYKFVDDTLSYRENNSTIWGGL